MTSPKINNFSEVELLKSGPKCVIKHKHTNTHIVN